MLAACSLRRVAVRPLGFSARLFASTPPVLASPDSFLSGTNGVYAEEMYRAYKEDPTSVHASWAAFFKGVDAGASPADAFSTPAAASGMSFSASSGARSLDVRAQHMVRAYQVRGHERAQVDPLGLWKPATFGAAADGAPELDLETYNFTEAEMDTPLSFPGVHGITGFLGGETKVTLRQLKARLEEVYCGPIGYEYMHIQNRAVCNWLRDRIELMEDTKFTKEERLQLLDRMVFAETLETFFASKYSTAKRFGLEGCEALVAGTKTLLDNSVQQGVTDVVIGMPHRGRINILANVMRKDLELIFKEFEETHLDLDATDTSDWSGSGDVKYHLGTSSSRVYPDGKQLKLSLVANPSHLEAVNPVVSGKVRAKQDTHMGSTIEATRPHTTNEVQWGRKSDGPVPEHTKRVLGLQIHGDAAFAGQGVVYETMGMSLLADYQTGGTIHVVCNNQVGFTTNPQSARSSLYCTDIGKTFSTPVFHVNADDPEAVARVFKLASDYRQEWSQDVIIDLIGYRRWGHNELDMPKFTQPIMYKAIDGHPTALELYKRRLVESGEVTQAEVDAVQQRANDLLLEKYEASKGTEMKEEWKANFSEPWKDTVPPGKPVPMRLTGVKEEELESVATILSTIPEGFELHSGLARVMKARTKALSEGAHLDWACGEALAFATLCREGFRVRLSGQDVERGTFSHRHAVVHDQSTGKRFCVFDQLGDESAPFTVANSHLSEYGVLGFETGYSLESPKHLVLWEAQFGDFANGAQIMVDQFISSGESKWGRQCGIVMLLPHGFEGQGPEHSSCRIERFLQAVDDPESGVIELNEDGTPVDHIQRANMQVLNVTTPANYFHALRRQMHRQFRKPLVIATPKSLLRLKEATSTFEDMGPKTYFKRIIDDPTMASRSVDDVRRVVLCSGKVYYDLAKYAAEHDVTNVAVVRVEQLAPFPADVVTRVLERYPADAEVVWTQEEPQNMGGWSYVAPRLASVTASLDRAAPRYVGRVGSASPAAGAKKVHDLEQKALVEASFE